MTDQESLEIAQTWLQRARSDLLLAKTALNTPGILSEDACFHAQQSVEKALKALLIRYHIAFPRTHVLETLLDLLKAAGVDVPLGVDEAFILTQYAVETRYPGDWEPVGREEALAAIEKAEEVLGWLTDRIES
jgi:HEPN domain-containing protein